VKWLESGNGRANPTATAWLNEDFRFFDTSGSDVHQKPGEVLDTEALGYRYEDQAIPGGRSLSALVPAQAEAALSRMTGMGGPGREPKEVGASGPIQIGAGATTATIELKQAESADLKRLALPDEGPRSVALVLEDVRPEDPGTPSFEVYMNIADVGEGGQHDSPHFVGFLEFFGADHAHGEHGEGGLTRVFDITSIVHQLEEAGSWDPARVQLTFTPARVLEDPQTGRLLAPPTTDKEPAVSVGSMKIVSE
jgi:tyrosinase